MMLITYNLSTTLLLNAVNKLRAKVYTKNHLTISLEIVLTFNMMEMEYYFIILLLFMYFIDISLFH